MPTRPADRIRFAGRGVVAAALLFIACSAGANPDDPADAPIRLPAEKQRGEDATTVPAAPPERKLFQQVRERAADVGDRATDMVLTALNFVGVRYRRGGDSEESGFDCSGFTRFVVGNSLGLVLPRRADEQARAPGLVEVKREDLQPGDLVFFNTLKRTFSHVGIYIGENRFVHAPKPGAEVRTEDMGYAYWRQRFTGARRAGMGTDRNAAPQTPAALATVSR